MTELMEIYKCEMCGNIVELLHGGPGELVCCGAPMAKMDPKTADWTTEKHVPVIEKAEHGIRVYVGSTLHPMEEDHYIEWIEVVADGKIYREHLKPGGAPEAFFCIDAENISAREYCNKHGLWTSQ